MIGKGPWQEVEFETSVEFKWGERKLQGRVWKRWLEVRLKGRKVIACLEDWEMDEADEKQEVGRWRGGLCPSLSTHCFSSRSMPSPTLGLREGIVCKAPTRPATAYMPGFRGVVTYFNFMGTGLHTETLPAEDPPYPSSCSSNHTDLPTMEWAMQIWPWNTEPITRTKRIKVRSRRRYIGGRLRKEPMGNHCH